jgi:hypothetical protein
LTGRPHGSGRLAVRARAAALLVLLATGCAATGPALETSPAVTQSAVRSELLFGRSKPDGSVVTDAEWHAFVVEHVTPRFPDGFTVIDAVGQYRDRSGRIMSEPTKILLIVHPADAGPRAAIQALRDAYRRLFQQESVLLVETPARLGF